MVVSDPLSMAIPLYWVSKRWLPADFESISDAGPLALGLVVYDSSFEMSMYTSYAFPFDVSEGEELQFKGPKFQNVREFLGIILALLVLSRVAKGHPCVINWRNDNISALSWVTNNMANSKAAQLAFLTYTWVGLMTGCRVELARHFPGVTMGFVDKLSRFMPTPELAVLRISRVVCLQKH